MIQVKFFRNFKLDPKKVDRTVYAVFLRLKDRGLNFLKKYPPQRNPNTKYERGFGVRPNQRVSEDLGARWNAEISYSASAVRVDFGNNASYSPFVMAKQYQADIHRDWWQTDEDMIELFQPQLTDDLVRFLPQAIIP